MVGQADHHLTMPPRTILVSSSQVSLLFPLPCTDVGHQPVHHIPIVPVFPRVQSGLPRHCTLPPTVIQPVILLFATHNHLLYAPRS